MLLFQNFKPTNNKLKALKFENVSFEYSRGKKIFDGVSFDIFNPSEQSGHIIALMGSSGSGKSTALKLAMGILKPQQGIIQTDPKQPVISYVPQEGVLFDHLSPLENARYFSRIAAYRKDFDYALFDHLSEVLDMHDLLQKAKNVNDLSGGQRQRLSLLRALSIKPDFLLLDEPTTGLDSEVKLHFLHQLRELVAMQNLLSVYVSHHKIETELIADEVIYFPHHSNGIGQVYQRDLLTFIQHPPILEAVQVFKYPKPNIIYCVAGTGGDILPAERSAEAGFYIVVESGSVLFHNDKGSPFKVVSQNPVYTVMEVDHSQLITIDTNLYAARNGDKLIINGRTLKYGKDQDFAGWINIRENQLENFVEI